MLVMMSSKFRCIKAQQTAAMDLKSGEIHGWGRKGPEKETRIFGVINVLVGPAVSWSALWLSLP